jgi:hypothetical protein
MVSQVGSLLLKPMDAPHPSGPEMNLTALATSDASVNRASVVDFMIDDQTLNESQYLEEML